MRHWSWFWSQSQTLRRGSRPIWRSEWLCEVWSGRRQWWRIICSRLRSSGTEISSLKYSCIMSKREYRSRRISRLLLRCSSIAKWSMMLETFSFRLQLISFGYPVSSISLRKSKILQRTFSTRLLINSCGKNTLTSTLNFKNSIRVLIITINWLRICSTTLPDSNKSASRQVPSKTGAHTTLITIKLPKLLVPSAIPIPSSCLTIWLIGPSYKVLSRPRPLEASASAPWRRGQTAALKSN